MAKYTLELNRSGVRELLRSDEMLAIVSEHAQATLNSCGSGYEMDARLGTNRARARVTTTTRQAASDNLKNNTLLKALQ